MSGRNKVYGVRIGRGERADDALAEMTRLEQTVEGVPAASLAAQLVAQRAPDLVGELRLMAAVNDIIGGAGDPATLVTQAVLPPAP